MKGMRLREQLLASDRAWRCLFPGSVLEAPKMELSAAHPAICEPLTVELAEGNASSWYAGVFYSCGPGQDSYSTLMDFLEERLLHVVAYAKDTVVAAGLVAGDEWTRWHLNFDRIELRSWRGTFDADIELVDDDELPSKTG